MRRGKYLLICLAIVACLAVLDSCTGASSPPPGINNQGNNGINRQVSPAAHTSISPTVNPSSLANIASMLDVVEHSVLQIDATGGTTIDTAGGQVPTQSAGSAWVIDSSGILITDEHVIEGAATITATTIEGNTYPAQVIKADPIADIAVLKINAVLPALKVADTSNLKVGDWVIIVGNPLGEGISAKQGIISRLKVNVPLSAAQTYENMIEVSAAINPGNSGGPLVNLSGEVIGIATIKVADVGIEGMGYATNMNDASPVIKKLSSQ